MKMPKIKFCHMLWKQTNRYFPKYQLFYLLIVAETKFYSTDVFISQNPIFKLYFMALAYTDDYPST